MTTTQQTMHQNEGKSIKNTHLESETSIYKCLFQLDDEPSLFSLENCCLIKHPLKKNCLEFQAYILASSLIPPLWVLQ